MSHSFPLKPLLDLTQTRMDDAARRFLKARNDPREVIADPSALYFGGKVDDRSLIPAGEHRAGPTRFEDWLPSSVSGH